MHGRVIYFFYLNLQTREKILMHLKQTLFIYMKSGYNYNCKRFETLCKS